MKSITKNFPFHACIVVPDFADLRECSEHDRNFLREIMRKSIRSRLPKLRAQEALLLLEAFDGVNAPMPLDVPTMPSFLADTVWSALLETPWGKGPVTLQEVIDACDSVADWGPGILNDPRVKFCQKLRELKPLNAGALYAMVKYWWADREFAQDGFDAKRPKTLHLDEYFVICK